MKRSQFNQGNHYSSDSNYDSSYQEAHCCKPKPIQDKCGDCSETIKEVLVIVCYLVKRSPVFNFNVDLELTVKTGNTYQMNVANNRDSRVVIKESLISDGENTISICDITRVRILTGQVVDTQFQSLLNESLQRLTTDCKNYSNQPQDETPITDASCNQDMQDYIYCYGSHINGFDFNGGEQRDRVITVLTESEAVDVIATITVEETLGEAIATIFLNTIPISAVDSISPNDISLVEDITVVNVDVISEVTPSLVTVSSPIVTTPINVVGSLDLVPPTNVITNISTTTTNVINSVTPTTADVISGFVGGTPITGVVSNVDTTSLITPTVSQLPEIASNSIGIFEAIIPQDAISAGVPSADVRIPVVIGTDPIAFNGNSNIFTLPTNANLLGGGTTNPTVTTVTQQGTPQLTQVVSQLDTGETLVVDNVIVDNQVAGSLVNAVVETPILNIDPPTTVSVVESLDVQTSNIDGIDFITRTTPADLFTISNVPVISSVEFITTTIPVIQDIQFVTTEIPVITASNLEQVRVLERVIPNIEGEIITVGNGIVAVNTVTNDTTVYSVCEINATTSL